MDADGNLKIAIVDDDPLFLEQLGNLLDLEQGISAVRIDDPARIEAVLSREQPDCLVIDYNLGIDNALNINETLNNRCANVPPVIMLSGAGDERTVVKAFRAGFADYVTKRQFNLGELTAAIRRAVARNHARGSVDPLAGAGTETCAITGLFTESFMRARLAELIANPHTKRFALIGIAVHAHQALRADLGYMTDQRLIAAFGSRLKSLMQGVEMAGMIAPDRWLVLIDRKADEAAIDALQARLRDGLAMAMSFNDLSVNLTPDLDHAVYPGDGADIDAILAKALPAQTRKADDRTEASAQDGAEDAPVVARSERRRDMRQRTIRRAKLLFDERRMQIICNVRDISTSGARLKLDTWVAAPDRFEMEIMGTGTMRSAMRRWQRGLEVGIEFV